MNSEFATLPVGASSVASSLELLVTTQAGPPRALRFVQARSCLLLSLSLVMMLFLISESLSFVFVDRAIRVFRRRIDRVELQGVFPGAVDDVVACSWG